MTPNGSFLYVLTGENNHVNVFGVTAGGSLKRIACAADCTTGDNSLLPAISPNGRFLYTTNADDGTVSPFTIQANGTLKPISCPGSSCQTAASPGQPAITPNGRFLYVPQGADSISAYSIGKTGSLTPMTCLTCATGAEPSGSAVTPDGRFLYVANYQSNFVSVFSIGSGGALKPVNCPATNCMTGAGPDQIAITPSGRLLYVIDESTPGAVSAFLIKPGGSLSPVVCGGPCSLGSHSNPFGVTVSPSGRSLYIANSLTKGSVLPFAIQHGGTLTAISCSPTACGAGNSPYGIVASPDQAPRAAFTVMVGNAGHSTHVDASSSSASSGQTLAHYEWNFGDGTTVISTRARLGHVYKKAGHYTITLTVVDNYGCSTSIVFTGQSAYCDGGPLARRTHRIDVKP
jgi:DNA-binding beta-propeller fold protein YncE